MTSRDTVKMPVSAVRKRTAGRPSAQQASELTALIVSVARQTMIRHGYDNASIDEIVAQSKISKKTFYARFASKGQLFEAVCLQIVEEIRSATTQVPLRDEPLDSALRKTALNLLSRLLTHEVVEFERMVVTVVPRFPEAARIVEKMRWHLLCNLRDLLSEAEGNGVLAIEDAEEAAHRFYEGAILPLFYRVSLGLRGTEITADDRVGLDRYIRFYLRGYAPPAGGPTR